MWRRANKRGIPGSKKRHQLLWIQPWSLALRHCSNLLYQFAFTKTIHKSRNMAMRKIRWRRIGCMAWKGNICWSDVRPWILIIRTAKQITWNRKFTTWIRKVTPHGESWWYSNARCTCGNDGARDAGKLPNKIHRSPCTQMVVLGLQ